jgi:predicted ArsR family transcriptional regulator
MKTSDKILHIIKREGAVTAKQLAGQFSITTMGARQHLQSLEKDGLLRFYDVKVKVGRPARHWALTGKGHEYFADRHGELTIQVIDAIVQVYGEQGLQNITATRENQFLNHYQYALSPYKTLGKKLEILVTLREEEGYMAELEQTPKGYILIENHCPICKAASKCNSFCQSELNIFRILLGDLCTIQRQEHIVLGHHRCSYLITPHEVATSMPDKDSE